MEGRLFVCFSFSFIVKCVSFYCEVSVFFYCGCIGAFFRCLFCECAKLNSVSYFQVLLV